MTAFIKNRVIVLCSAILFTIILLLSWYDGLIAEDAFHCTANSYKEAFDIACICYNSLNARIGELFYFFLTTSSEGTGILHALWFYRIANPIFVTACALFLFRIGTGKWPTDCKADIISFIFLIFCLLNNKTGFFWLASNLNWFYPTVIAMLLFIMVEPIFKGEKELPQRNFLIAICCAPIVGMSNESVSIVSFILYLSACIVYVYKNNFTLLDKKYILIGIILLIFALFFYLAPGPYNRVDESHGNSKIIFFLKNIFSSSWLHILFWCCRLIFISILASILCPIGAWKHARNYVLIVTVLMLGGILLLAPNFGMPRAIIPAELVTIALLTAIVHHSVREGRLRGKKLLFLMFSIITISITILIPNTVRNIDTARYFNQIQQRANQAIANGQHRLVLNQEEIPFESIWQFPYFRLPRTLIEIYPLYTKIKPFYTVDWEDYQNSRFEHKYALYPYLEDDLSGTDITLNKGFAKYFGLKALIIVRPHRTESENKS